MDNEIGVKMKKKCPQIPQITQRGWHLQPIIASGIRKFRKKNFRMNTRFCNIVIKIKKKPKIIRVICVICGLKIRG